MTAPLHWTLADADTHLDNLNLNAAHTGGKVPGDWSVRKRTLRGGFREGVEVIDVDSGRLRFTVVPTRGMGLWRAHLGPDFRLGWDAPVRGPVHPHFVDLDGDGGVGWLRGFDELLCRCGLAANGPPGKDGGAELTLHGRVANTPAHSVTVEIDLEPPHAIRVCGRVAEGGLFLPTLELRTTYEIIPGSATLAVRDEVHNPSDRPAEFQLLYHLNLGTPLLEAGAKLAVPHAEIAPQTPRAAGGIAEYDAHGSPEPGFAEQVYQFRPLADAAGRTLALLHDAAARRAVVVRWGVRELPCFTTWKNTGGLADGYVTGLEPATNYSNFKAFEREHGRVGVLGPGRSWGCAWTIEALDDPAGVAAALAEVSRMQAGTTPVVHPRPTPPFAPG